MEYRNLGNSGLKVSRNGLGCNNFGMLIDEAATAAVVHAALDEGVNFFDTSDIYGAGGSESEIYLGRALGARRHEAVVATKFGLPTGAGPNDGGGSRRHVLAAAEASLRRLGTDYIDVYLQHVPDATTPVEETLDALDALVRQGKVRYAGCSNFSGWQITEAAWQARSRGCVGFVAAQNEWSLLSRGIEQEVVPACEKQGLSILPYFPLASGALTGKYRRGQSFADDSRYARSETMRAHYPQFVAEETLATVERLEAVASEAGLTLLELALSWLAQQPVVASVIAGATRPEQVGANVKATRGALDDDVLAAVEVALAGA